jgi:alpha-mannosidase
MNPSKIIFLACLLGCLLAIASAQQSILKNEVVSDHNPKLIDLTQPTLFIVPYTHLDDVWRWSHPQTIRDFLKNTLDENFRAFE